MVTDNQSQAEYFSHISEIHALIQNKKESGSFWKGGISGKAETLEKRKLWKNGISGKKVPERNLLQMGRVKAFFY